MTRSPPSTPERFPAPTDRDAALADSRVLVVGLGRFGGGVGVTQWLANLGASVTVTDCADPSTLAESIHALDGFNVRFHWGRHDVTLLDDTTLVVINPAVDKRRSGLFQDVLRRGIRWTTEMNLFCRRCRADVVAVTGSYGKSTTAAMLAHALRQALHKGECQYRQVHLGGNIGRSLLPELKRIDLHDLVVLEISSAQLEDLPRIEWAPMTAVVTNLFPHHLDRHGSYEDYMATKLNILGTGRTASKVIAGDLDPQAEARLRERLSETGRTWKPVHRPDPPVALRIPGPHNQGNAACVLAVGRHLGLAEQTLHEALRSFPGLPHRLELVRTLDGVIYYNDSKSTAPATTMTALESLSAPIVALVGGYDSDVSLDLCADRLCRACRAVICTGASGPTFVRAIQTASAGRDASSEGYSTLVHERHSLSEAVQLAQTIARPGDVVLFSPGAPSFDAYSNFAQRGRHFTDLVQRLPSGRHEASL